MPKYMITLTSSTHFVDVQLEMIKTWFSEYSQHVMTVEAHQDGTPHVHGVVDDPVVKACSVTKKLARLYERMGQEVTRYSIQVKTVKALNGALSYCMKDVDDKKGPATVSGWTIKGLLDIRAANLKKIPAKLLTQDWLQLNESTAAPAMLEYAKRKAMRIGDRYEFAEVFAAMKADRYQFGRVRLVGVYTSVMAVLGDKSCAVAEALDALCDMPH